MTESGTAAPRSEPSETNIAGFWRRLLAFSIDGVLLGVPAALLGLVFFDRFAQLGGWGRLVGFVICLFYFAPLNSVLANGQTIGKRILRIRVVGLNDAPISLLRSTARFAILEVPYFLNGAAIPPRLLFGWLGIVVSVLIFGFGFSIIYLLVFNRRNRRSLHDLIVGTYVVKAGTEPGAKRSTWIGHYFAVAIIVIASFALPFIVASLADRPMFKELLAVQTRIINRPAVDHASVMAGKSFATGAPSATSISVGVYLKKRIDDYDKFANQVARDVLETYQKASAQDRIIINIVYGYDLGIAWASLSRGYAYSPAEWKERIKSE